MQLASIEQDSSDKWLVNNCNAQSNNTNIIVNETMHLHGVDAVGRQGVLFDMDMFGDTEARLSAKIINTKKNNVILTAVKQYW